MATEIYNEGPCFRVVRNGQQFLITKVQIKRIDTLRGYLVRVDIGEGALKHVYFDINEVTVPAVYKDPLQLRDVLLGWMRQSAASKEAKQDIEINELVLIRQALQAISIGGGIKTVAGGGFADPLREDESVPNTIYKGYAVPDAQTYDPVWAIVRITRIEDQIIYEWADGNQYYDNIWDNRYVLNYTTNTIAPAR